MIVRYNMNCYAQFRTERGLQQYLGIVLNAEIYMLEQTCSDAGIETINSTRHQSYGTQCTRLNYKVNAEPPLYALYKEF
jgi:hypothetical protein